MTKQNSSSKYSKSGYISTPGGTNSSKGESYHYSNKDGSYYYQNDSGSKYYAAPSGVGYYTPAPKK